MYSVFTGYLNMFQTCHATHKPSNEIKMTPPTTPKTNKWQRLLKMHKNRHGKLKLPSTSRKPTSTLDFEFDSNDLEYYYKNYSTAATGTVVAAAAATTTNNCTKSFNSSLSNTKSSLSKDKNSNSSSSSSSTPTPLSSPSNSRVKVNTTVYLDQILDYLPLSILL